MKQPISDNWPTMIYVELPCECCGDTIKVPFVVKEFKGYGSVDWPFYIEFRSPTLCASTCPNCKMPFRINRPLPARIQ